MARKPKVNLSELKQTHGALAAPVSIDELTGRIEGYPVQTLEEYRQLLANMSDQEMQDHAIEVADIVPIAVRSLLIQRLEAKFASVKNVRPPVIVQNKMSKQDQEFQKKFFGEAS